MSVQHSPSVSRHEPRSYLEGNCTLERCAEYWRMWVKCSCSVLIIYRSLGSV